MTLALTALGVGAQQPASGHWAFTLPRRVVPDVRDADWCRDDLDRCVLAGLEAAGVRPSPPAE
ncbi:MAG: hypothetical protein WAT39_18395, partial [Planctomycetota bacterium]